MRTLALGALIAGVLVACNGKKKVTLTPDAPGSGMMAVCNVLAQTGCMPGQKCTWIHDDDGTPLSCGSGNGPPLGHIGCAPNGTMPRDGGCSYGPPGATGYDDCMAGDICVHSVCKQICDGGGGSPTCDTQHACVEFNGLFGPPGQAVAAGACNALCDPLADNTFGKGTRAGSSCGSAEGCYGGPNNVSAPKYSCSREFNTTLVHRSACTVGNCCVDQVSNLAFLNGCAQGFVPLLFDMTGSMQVDCISFCKPAPCYAGNCNAAGDAAHGNLGGDPASTHVCNATDSSGSFKVATLGTGGVNGEQCYYEWRDDVGSNGQLTGSATANKVGYCFDHSRYLYDPTGGTNRTTPIPKCDTLTNPGLGSDINTSAAFWGCVDTGTCGSDCASLLQGKRELPPSFNFVDRPHTLYHRVFAQ